MSLSRAAFAGIVPSLLIPVLVGIAGPIGRALHPDPSDYSFDGLIVAVFAFVLLGSMTLNGWLLLRHPQSLTTRELPRRIAIVLVLLVVVQVIWIVLMLVGVYEAPAVAIAVVLMVLSIASFALAIGRYRDREPVAALQSVELPTAGRVLAIVYIVVGALAILAAVYGTITGAAGSAAAGVLGGPAIWVLLLLGLPWSHPVYFASVILLFVFSPVLAGAGEAVVPTLMIVGVIVNMVIAVQLLRSPAVRVRLVNWFFRLGTPLPETQKAPTAEPSTPPVS